MVLEGKPAEKNVLWQLYKVPILLGGCSLLFIVLSIYLIIKVYQSSEPIQFSSGSEKQASASANGTELIIDVSGAVQKPGVYRMQFGSRVEDAIVIAGGLTLEADKEKISLSINRAAKLSDGAKVFIPKKIYESKSQVAASGQSSINSVSDGVVFIVSINTSNSSDLERLNGIGPATAAKIITGLPYGRIDELVEKKIISQSLFDKLKSQLTL